MQDKLAWFTLAAIVAVLTISPALIASHYAHENGYEEGVESETKSHVFIFECCKDTKDPLCKDLTKAETKKIQDILKGRAASFNVEYNWKKDGLHIGVNRVDGGVIGGTAGVTFEGKKSK